MKKNNQLRVLACTMVLAACAMTLRAGDFKLVRQEGAVVLYERWVQQQNEEKVREIKAVFSVRSTIAAVVALFRDQEKGKSWNINVRQYKILHMTDEHAWIGYVHYHVPWPMDDQDCCLQYHFRWLDGQGKAAEVTFESIDHPSFPVKKNVARITGTHGRWLLESLSDGQLKITYQVITDRSKTIPRWVSDPVVHDHLFKTMTRFRNMLEQTGSR